MEEQWLVNTSTAVRCRVRTTVIWRWREATNTFSTRPSLTRLVLTGTRTPQSCASRSHRRSKTRSRAHWSSSPGVPHDGALRAARSSKLASSMRPNRSIPQATVIPVLIYPDVREAVDWLSAAFGFLERVQIGENHRSQLSVGDGAVI